MKQNWIPAFAGMTMLLAGCDGIGEGSTIRSLTIQPSPVGILEQGAPVDTGGPTEHYRMFDCFCSNVVAVARFTDGAQANFNFRVTWASSDPSIVQVMGAADGVSDLCPITQQGPGMLIPRGVGTATITATFAGMSDTFTVEVNDSSAGTFTLEPTAPATTSHVAVGADLPLTVSGTLDGRSRLLNGNVTTWDFVAPDDDVATINSIGFVRGVAADQGTPLTARATFAACSDLQPTLQIRVGEVAGLLLAEESAEFTPDDDQLAANSDELLTVLANLDFGDATTGSQILGSQSRLTATDPCTLRSYQLGASAGGLTDCAEDAGATCDTAVPVCATSQTSCTSGMTACRLVASPMSLRGGNRIIAVSDANAPTTFTAHFPNAPGSATTLSAAVDASTQTLTVASLSGYPVTPPWDAIIDAAGAMEIVRVRTQDGLTLTVDRGIAGTSAQAHDAGATFELRTFSSGTLPIQADGRTLGSFTIDPPASSTLDNFTALQLQASGIFTDTDATDPVEADRTQRVTRLTTFATGSPTVVWSSSNTTIASVSSTSGEVASRDACGGTVVIRARATTSTNEEDDAFAAPDAAAAGADDLDGNGNTDANDQACADDPLCDQVALTVPQQDPLPPEVASCP